jgi:integration host factor subunit beta
MVLRFLAAPYCLPLATMTKSELITRLAARYPQLVAKDAEIAVKLILAAISERLSDAGRIEIRGFGTFSLRYRPPRTGRNPKSGEKVEIPGKYAPHFKAGGELRERVSAQNSEPVGGEFVIIREWASETGYGSASSTRRNRA